MEADKVAKDTEVQKLLEVRVNAAGAWRERARTLTGEVSQAVTLAVVTTKFGLISMLDYYTTKSVAC